MEYIVLNGTDLKVSKICLGGGNFGEKLTSDTIFKVLDAFAEAGGNFIDTANVYCRWVPGLANSSEEMIGEFYLNKRNLRLYEEFLAIHKETGESLITLSVAFLLNQPFDVVPVGSVTKLEQLDGLVKASEIRLDKKLIEKFGAELEQ